MDNIKTGDIIFICHYSALNPYKCIVTETVSDHIVVKVAKEFAARSFIQGDPAVAVFEKSAETIIMGCIIVNIDTGKNIIEIKFDSIDPCAEQRSYERFPVSLYADVRLDRSRKKEMIKIKDISYYGLLLFSEADLPMDGKLDIDIYMDKQIFFLKGIVLRKVKSEYHNEYGVRIVYEYSSALSVMRDYIHRLQDEQEELIRKQKQKGG